MYCTVLCSVDQVFLEVQAEAARKLEPRFAEFCCSALYARMLEECAEDEEDSEDTEDSGPEAGTSPSEGEESVPTSASSARLRLEGVEEQLRNKLQAQVGSIKYFYTRYICKIFLSGRAAEVAASGQPRAAEHLRGDPRAGGREDGAGAAHRADRGLDTAPGQVGAVARYQLTILNPHTQRLFLGLVKLVLLDGGSGYRSHVWAAAVCRSP